MRDGGYLEQPALVAESQPGAFAIQPQRALVIVMPMDIASASTPIAWLGEYIEMAQILLRSCSRSPRIFAAELRTVQLARHFIDDNGWACGMQSRSPPATGGAIRCNGLIVRRAA
jgi:hypothetical protein